MPEQEQEQEQKDVDRDDRGELAVRTTNYVRAGSDLWAGASDVTGDWILAEFSSGMRRESEREAGQDSELESELESEPETAPAELKVRSPSLGDSTFKGARAAAGATYLPHNGAAATK